MVLLDGIATHAEPLKKGHAVESTFSWFVFVSGLVMAVPLRVVGQYRLYLFVGASWLCVVSMALLGLREVLYPVFSTAPMPNDPWTDATVGILSGTGVCVLFSVVSVLWAARGASATTTLLLDLGFVWGPVCLCLALVGPMYHTAGIMVATSVLVGALTIGSFASLLRPLSGPPLRSFPVTAHIVRGPLKLNMSWSQINACVLAGLCPVPRLIMYSFIVCRFVEVTQDYSQTLTGIALLAVCTAVAHACSSILAQRLLDERTVTKLAELSAIGQCAGNFVIALMPNYESLLTATLLTSVLVSASHYQLVAYRKMVDEELQGVAPPLIVAGVRGSAFAAANYFLYYHVDSENGEPPTMYVLMLAPVLLILPLGISLMLKHLYQLDVCINTWAAVASSSEPVVAWTPNSLSIQEQGSLKILPLREDDDIRPASPSEDRAALYDSSEGAS